MGGRVPAVSEADTTALQPDKLPSKDRQLDCRTIILERFDPMPAQPFRGSMHFPCNGIDEENTLPDHLDDPEIIDDDPVTALAKKC
ncbi:hypothetical protein GCM10020255_026430 [Rhodococcus baikonurensis]